MRRSRRICRGGVHPHRIHRRRRRNKDHQQRLNLDLVLRGNAKLVEEFRGRVGITDRMAPLRFVRQVSRFRDDIEERAHVQVEGELRSREYQRDGAKQKVFECRLESILKLDRAARRDEDRSDHSES